MKLKKIVKCILKFPEDLTRDEIYEISKLYVYRKYQNKFTGCFDFFSLDMEWKEPTEKICRFLYYENTVDNFLIVSETYPSIYDVEFFDYRKQDFNGFWEFTTSCLQKKAGILLQHKNNRSLEHSYFSRKVHLGEMTLSSLIPVYPESKFFFYYFKF